MFCVVWWKSFLWSHRAYTPPCRLWFACEGSHAHVCLHLLHMWLFAVECLPLLWPRCLITKCDGWWGMEEEEDGGGDPYSRPRDQRHQCALKKRKKKKSAPLHSREEPHLVMMLTQDWSMCTLLSHSACPEREGCVCGCFNARRSVCIISQVTGDQSEIYSTPRPSENVWIMLPNWCPICLGANRSKESS